MMTPVVENRTVHLHSWTDRPHTKVYIACHQNPIPAKWRERCLRNLGDKGWSTNLRSARML
jgi:hypothetical protein